MPFFAWTDMLMTLQRCENDAIESFDWCFVIFSLEKFVKITRRMVLTQRRNVSGTLLYDGWNPLSSWPPRKRNGRATRAGDSPRRRRRQVRRKDINATNSLYDSQARSNLLWRPGLWCVSYTALVKQLQLYEARVYVRVCNNVLSTIVAILRCIQYEHSTLATMHGKNNNKGIIHSDVCIQLYKYLRKLD